MARWIVHAPYNEIGNLAGPYDKHVGWDHFMFETEFEARMFAAGNLEECMFLGYGVLREVGFDRVEFIRQPPKE